MRLFKICVVLLSAGLFMYALVHADPVAAFSEAVEIGVVGTGVILGLYLVVFVLDSFSWHLTVSVLPLTILWLYRLWKVRMVGEAFNVVLPVGGMGGEPIKAILMKSRYSLDYRDSVASLILARTINLIALVFFLGIGFWLILLYPALPASLTTMAGVGLGGFTVAVFAFFAVQRWRITSRIGGWLSRTVINYRIDAVLHHIEDMDHRLTAFYIGWRPRFILALILATGTWALGALQVYVTARFLGMPINLADAWIVEAIVQMVRAGTFFIPASVGAQESAFLVVFTALGVPAPTAMAVALLRRVQEIVLVAWGMLLSANYHICVKDLQTVQLLEKNTTGQAVTKSAWIRFNQGIDLGPTDDIDDLRLRQAGGDRSRCDGWPGPPGGQIIPIPEVRGSAVIKGSILARLSWIFPLNH